MIILLWLILCTCGVSCALGPLKRLIGEVDWPR